MDCERWGGPVFIGTTALLAFLDGVLGATIIAGAGSVLVYKYVCKLMNRAPAAIYAHKESEYKAQLLEIKDKKQREKYSKKVTKDLEELAKMRAMDDNARREAVKLIALGAFVCPIAGLAAAAAFESISRAKRRQVKI